MMLKGQYKLEQYRDEIYDYYCNQKLSFCEIARRLNCSHETVRKYIIYSGWQTESRKNRKPILYKANENFFSSIDTESKAYWLGFIGADGNVEKTLLRLRILLNDKDEKHLEKFQKDIETNSPIRKVGENKVYIAVCCKRICEDLSKLGVIPNKTLTYNNNWDAIPEELWHHYIRGYFDGDGSIWKQKRDNYWGINFTGSHYLINSLRDRLPVYTSLSIRENVSVISTMNKTSIVQLINYMYNDATIYLDRKYEKAKQALNDYQGVSII